MSNADKAFGAPQGTSAKRVLRRLGSRYAAVKLLAEFTAGKLGELALTSSRYRC